MSRPQTTASGSGSSQGTSGRVSSVPLGPPLGAPIPVGSSRRCLLCRAVRQALVAIEYIQVRSEDRFSNRSYARQARR